MHVNQITLNDKAQHSQLQAFISDVYLFKGYA